MVICTPGMAIQKIASGLNNMENFHLVDYKGKFTIACDNLDEQDFPVGKISRENLIAESKWRKTQARYYGVPAYIGKDKELNKIFKPQTSNRTNQN